MASTLKYIIEKQPKLVKKIAYKIIPFKYRYGKTYINFLSLLKDSNKWSYDEAINYQFLKLKNVLKEANENIPYYTKLFKDIGFDYNIKNFDDIKNIPYLTKDIVIKNYNELISKKYSGRRYDMNTSGSTGKRLSILGTDDLFKIECAFITNAFNDHGAKLYQKHSVWIRRYSPSETDPIFLNDYELNRSYMSAFHLNDESIFSYVNYINDVKSEILVSYPSTIYYLAVLCEKYNLELKNIKYIHGASEVCLPQWRTKIKEVFGVPIKMHYGQVEKVSFAHQDGEDDNYRENLLYGFNEFTEDYSIIATGFYNDLMPLIRYKTNDKVILNNNIKREGAFPKIFKEFIGRDGDMLITEKDSLVPAVNFYSFMSKIKEVDLFQIIQTKSTKSVDFFIVPNAQYNEKIYEKLIQEMKNRLGEVNINLILVDELKRDETSNKMKTVSLI
jgi:phenylacetate-CoA ligase